MGRGGPPSGEREVDVAMVPVDTVNSKCHDPASNRLEEGHESIYETREHQYRIDRNDVVEGWRIGTPASKEYADKLASQGKIKIR